MKTSIRSASVRLLALGLVCALVGWGLREVSRTPLPAPGPGQAQQALIVSSVAVAPFAVPVLTALWRAARE